MRRGGGAPYYQPMTETPNAPTATGRESIIWEGTPSQITNLPSILLGAVVATGLTVAGSFFVFPLTGPLFFVIAAGVWLICLAPGLWQMLNTRFYNYELTSERLKLTTGILSRNTDVMELYRVKDMNLAQPFILRLFGLSNVTLITSDRSMPVFVLRAIRNGTEVLDIVRNHVESLRDKKRVREVDFEDGDSDGDFDNLG